MTLTVPPKGAPAGYQPPSRWASILKARELPIIGVLVIVLLGTSLANHDFLSGQGRIDLMKAVAITALMAVGETFVIVMKHVDLSVGSALGLSGYIAAYVVGQGGNVVVVFAISSAVGLVIGLINGLLVATLRLPSLVVTLGSL